MVSEEKVDAIIKRCEKDSVIRGYYALINEGNLPKQRVRALIEVSVEPERDSGFDRIARNLSKFSEVSDVLLISGNFDLLLIVVGDSLMKWRILFPGNWHHWKAFTPREPILC